jgi:hypothetical protein
MGQAAQRGDVICVETRMLGEFPDDDVVHRLHRFAVFLGQRFGTAKVRGTLSNDRDARGTSRYR